MTYLTTRDVAALLGLKSTEAVVTLITEGRLPCERIRKGKDGRNLYRPTIEEVISYLEAYDPAMVKKAKERWSFRAA